MQKKYGFPLAVKPRHRSDWYSSLPIISWRVAKMFFFCLIFHQPGTFFIISQVIIFIFPFFGLFWVRVSFIVSHTKYAYDPQLARLCWTYNSEQLGLILTALFLNAQYGCCKTKCFEWPAIHFTALMNNDLLTTKLILEYSIKCSLRATHLFQHCNFAQNCSKNVSKRFSRLFIFIFAFFVCRYSNSKIGIAVTWNSTIFLVY